MPLVSLPDGAGLQWERKGQGPLVVLATQFFGYPAVFEGLTADLASDHRVITYDPRGMGGSSRQGPYNIATDAGDLATLIDAAADGSVGEGAVVLGIGDGANRAVALAAQRPELVRAIVCPGGSPAGRAAAEGADALVNSPSVLTALVGMIETDYRAALRTMVTAANPHMGEEEARDRVDRVVAYCPQDVGAARLRDWIGNDVVSPAADARLPGRLEEARTLGDRIWILSHTSTAWFPAAAADRTRQLLPEARLVEVQDGPISRPDLTAAVVREITSAGRVEGAGRTGGAARLRS